MVQLWQQHLSSARPDSNVYLKADLMFAFFQKNECVSKINRSIATLFFAYIVFGSLLIIFDFGTTPWGQWIAQLGRSLIPSIKGTAEITSAPSSAAALLSIAWLWGVVMYAPMAWLLLTATCQVVDWEHWDRLSWVIKSGMWTGTLAATFVMAHLVPTNVAGMERIVFTALNASPIYIVFLGIVVWATVWMGLLIPTIVLMGLFNKFNRGDGS